MEIIFISLVAFGISLLAFYSGFGLGTILLPVFAFFFPVEIAITMTAIVHLANNLFKGFLIWRYIDYGIVVIFAIPAAIFAFIGAFVLKTVATDTLFYTITLFNYQFHITWLKLMVGMLMILFSVVELSKNIQKITFPKKTVPIGGVLSGFFGGISGHQGALRSMFLINIGLSKEAFIATCVAASVIVDISRLTVYGTAFLTENALGSNNTSSKNLIISACLAAFLGSFIGRKLLKKVSLDAVNKIVGVMILITAFLLILGII